MSRLKAFEDVLGDWAEERFQEIRREGEASGLETTDRNEFKKLPAVTRLLDELGAGESGAAALEEYATFLYVSYRYWLGGRNSFEVSLQHLERLLSGAGEAAGRREAEVPRGACYFLLPERLFWAQIQTGAPHEPLDGLFLVSDRERREITVLAVLGLREERMGFSQVAITAPAEDFYDARLAVRDPPFAPVMEGGLHGGVHSVVSEGELLYLGYLALTTLGG